MTEQELSQFNPTRELADSHDEAVVGVKKEINVQDAEAKLEGHARQKFFKLYDTLTSSFENKKISRKALDKSILELDDLMQKELGYTIGEWLKSSELSDEEINFSQSLFDFLSLEYNLKEHIRGKSIDLISKEQREALGKKGYNYTLIIPGDMERNELLERIEKSFAKEFNSNGILYKYLDQTRDDLAKTQIAEDKMHQMRPGKPYQIMLKLPKDLSGEPLLETSDAHPETMGQSLSDYLGYLEWADLEEPILNLKGLTIIEYLIFQAGVYHMAKQKGKRGKELENSHLDVKTHTLLLGELYYDRDKSTMRSFECYWDDRLAVYITPGMFGMLGKPSYRGTRYAAIPKISKIN